MVLLEKLKADNGIISSALDKALAQEVMDGETDILLQAVHLTQFELDQVESRNVRVGAARIVEFVAKKRPDLVAPHLSKLLPALETPEPQTKWLLLITLGYCAKLNPLAAIEGLDYAKKFIAENPGMGVAGAAERYLGYIGSLSPNVAQEILPTLLYALHEAKTNEVNWAIEALTMICDKLKAPDKKVVITCAEAYLDSPKKSTVKRVERLIAKAKAA